MNKIFIILIVLILLIGAVLYGNVLRQKENNKQYTLGIVVRGKSYEPGVIGFKEKMRELGFQEGKNIKWRGIHVVFGKGLKIIR